MVSLKNTNGLSEKVKYEVMSKVPKTMDAALAIAMDAALAKTI
jgi:hypothetical protein